ncbi:MAG: ornithine cyclodeaminase family protein, partial [Thermoanaerobaculia bacterium]
MQKTVVLTRRDVEDLLPMRECIEVMERALRELATGRAFQPLRTVSRTSDAVGLLGLMPAWRGGEEPLWSLKEICVFPDNPSRGLDTHLGAVLLHSGRTGELLAIVNAAAITAIRTAAVTAVATRILARTGARTLAIIGT